VRIRSRLIRRKRNEIALTVKHHPAPTTAISTPPTAGPTTSPALLTLALRATAFGRSFRPTTRKVNACLLGASRIVPSPPNAASTKNGHGSVVVKARVASVRATTSCPVCVRSTAYEFSKRSASVPREQAEDEKRQVAAAYEDPHPRR